MFGDKMKTPEWVTQEQWETLTDQEKDFLRLIGTGKFSRKQIKRFLYINSEVTYWRFRKRVLAKVSKGKQMQ